MIVLMRIHKRFVNTFGIIPFDIGNNNLMYDFSLFFALIYFMLHYVSVETKLNSSIKFAKLNTSLLKPSP